MELTEVLEDPRRSRALFCWNINIAASNPEQQRLRSALAREDLFTVAIDLFATDTVDLADIVLPAASFLESDDIVVPYFNRGSLGAQVKAAEPLGESLPNSEIFRRIARAMGYTEPELYESDADVIARVLSSTGITFAELSERGTVWLSEEPVVAFEEMRFPTPSGRIELASGAALRDGHPRVAQPHHDARPSGGRLRLLTPASPWILNHTFANESKLLGRIGPAAVAIHPLDAAERGIGAGDEALLTSSAGQLRLAVTLSDELPRGVAYSPKGHWPKQEGTRANVNVLNPGGESDMGRSTIVHGVEVMIAPA
jgi:anaerobic selenocysteine-containing dehydrogenase